MGRFEKFGIPILTEGRRTVDGQIFLRTLLTTTAISGCLLCSRVGY
jgi:hypothetical protein